MRLIELQNVLYDLPNLSLLEVANRCYLFAVDELKTGYNISHDLKRKKVLSIWLDIPLENFKTLTVKDIREVYTKLCSILVLLDPLKHHRSSYNSNIRSPNEHFSIDLLRAGDFLKTKLPVHLFENFLYTEFPRDSYSLCATTTRIYMKGYFPIPKVGDVIKSDRMEYLSQTEIRDYIETHDDYVVASVKEFYEEVPILLVRNLVLYWAIKKREEEEDFNEKSYLNKNNFHRITFNIFDPENNQTLIAIDDP